MVGQEVLRKTLFISFRLNRECPQTESCRQRGPRLTALFTTGEDDKELQPRGRYPPGVRLTRRVPKKSGLFWIILMVQRTPTLNVRTPTLH